jgi:hypothetical protein
MAEMISDETRTLVRLATESLRKDILRQLKAHSLDDAVPCKPGLREFSRLVDMYWGLAEKVGPEVAREYGEQAMMAREEPMGEARDRVDY